MKFIQEIFSKKFFLFTKKLTKTIKLKQGQDITVWKTNCPALHLNVVCPADILENKVTINKNQETNSALEKFKQIQKRIYKKMFLLL